VQSENYLNDLNEPKQKGLPMDKVDKAQFSAEGKGIKLRVKGIIGFLCLISVLITIGFIFRNF